MSTFTEYTNITYVTEICYKCGCYFAMTKDFRYSCKEKGVSFHCPNGHSQIYTAQTKEEIERDKHETTKRQLQQMRERNKCLVVDLETQKNMTRAQKAAKTKLKKRIHNGVCPCCKRSFQNLRKHMEGQHPDYIEHPNSQS